jgi:hypothetical protein
MQSEEWSQKSIEDLCASNPEERAKQDHIRRRPLVRLPHVPPDISAKLGFETLRAPNLSEQQAATPLVAGFPGDLPLEGERLWRSPSVYLNSQKADRIDVRPDMRGIVAHFNCVLPPPDLTNGFVTVVTSEGSVHMTAPIGIDIPTLDRNDGRSNKRPSSRGAK